MVAKMVDDGGSVAVVGAGISGLAAAFILKHQGKRVTLFERESVCGGHALTVDTEEFGPVDIGFQVCNLTTYPHLMGLLRVLGIDTEPSDMSFALSTPDIEWGSRGLDAIFAQPGAARSPKFLKMLYEVIRFGKQAPEVLTDDKWATATLGDYLRRRGYSKFFEDHYVVPMCAAIWSCSDSDALAFPVRPLMRFWKNHHLLDLVDRPTWRVLKGRSRAYVDALTAQLSDVRVNSCVERIERRAGGGVALHVGGAKAPEMFDDVVLATHSDITLAMLGDSASDAERKALGAIAYQASALYRSVTTAPHRTHASTLPHCTPSHCIPPHPTAPYRTPSHPTYPPHTTAYHPTSPTAPQRTATHRIPSYLTSYLSPMTSICTPIYLSCLASAPPGHRGIVSRPTTTRLPPQLAPTQQAMGLHRRYASAIG